MADALAAEGIAVVVTHPLHPDDNVPLYELIGGLFGANAAAADLIRRYKAARAILGDATAYPRRRAVYLIWRDPWMAITADTYIGAALSLMNIDAVTPGADPALDGDAARYPAVTLDDDALAGVDLVLFSTEPFAFTDDHLAAFRAAHPDHAHKAHLIDGEMTSWYGSRAIAGLGYLQTFAEKLGANG